MLAQLGTEISAPDVGVNDQAPAASVDLAIPEGSCAKKSSKRFPQSRRGSLLFLYTFQHVGRKDTVSTESYIPVNVHS